MSEIRDRVREQIAKIVDEFYIEAYRTATLTYPLVLDKVINQILSIRIDDRYELAVVDTEASRKCYNYEIAYDLEMEDEYIIIPDGWVRKAVIE